MSSLHQHPPMNVPLLPIPPTTLQEKFGGSRQGPTVVGQQLSEPWVESHHPNGDRYFNDPESGVFTEFDPRESDNAAVFQGAKKEIRQRIAERNIVHDVSIVLALHNGTDVAYYLVDNVTRKIFWLQDVADVVAGHPGECLRKFFLHQYYHHVRTFPPTNVDPVAERNLIARLLVLQTPGYLSPWPPEDCRQHLADIETNRATKSEMERMAHIALLLSSIYRQQHEHIHGRYNGRNNVVRNADQVVRVPGLDLNQSDWAVLLQVLADPDLPIGAGMAYSLLLTRVNQYVGEGGPLNDMLYVTTLTIVIAALLLCVTSPAIFLLIAKCIIEDPASARMRHWILSFFMAFNIFVYGCLLSAFGRCLEGPEHQLSMAGLVLVTFVLALPPAFHALRLSYDLD